LRIDFEFNGFESDLPITDPVFCALYRANNDLVENTSSMFLTLSLAIEFNEWHYKLVAGIIHQ
jgi:hypothetical protein